MITPSTSVNGVSLIISWHVGLRLLALRVMKRAGPLFWPLPCSLTPDEHYLAERAIYIPFPRVFWFKFPTRPRHRATHELMTRRRYRFFSVLSPLSCFHPLHFIHYPLPLTGSHFHSSISGIQLFSHFLRRSPTLHSPLPPRVSHAHCLFFGALSLFLLSRRFYSRLHQHTVIFNL